MRICVVGAGAIGGLLGAKLALADNEVTLFDQGAHLEAIKRNGLKLIWEDDSESWRRSVRRTSSSWRSRPITSNRSRPRSAKWSDRRR
jgi:2-dehydropantoate 2-reductase